jgi:hypothetical protein
MTDSKASTAEVSILVTRRAEWMSPCITISTPRSRASGLTATAAASKMLAGPLSPLFKRLRKDDYSSGGCHPASTQRRRAVTK